MISRNEPPLAGPAGPVRLVAAPLDEHAVVLPAEGHFVCGTVIMIN